MHPPLRDRVRDPDSRAQGVTLGDTAVNSLLHSGYKVLRSRSTSPSSLVNYMYKNCAGGMYVREVGALLVLRCCDLRFNNTLKSTQSSFYLPFLVQSETNTARISLWDGIGGSYISA